MVGNIFFQCAELKPVENLWSELKRKVYMHKLKNIKDLLYIQW